MLLLASLLLTPSQAKPLGWLLNGASKVELDTATDLTLYRGPETQHLPAVAVKVPVPDQEELRSTLAVVDLAGGWSTMTLEAANGRDALSLVERHAPDVALVFTDVMMPLMDGAALNAELASRYPYIPVIAASGLDVPVDPTRWGSARPARILSKPFTSDALLQAIARVVYRDDVESPPSSAS